MTVKFLIPASVLEESKKKPNALLVPLDRWAYLGVHIVGKAYQLHKGELVWRNNEVDSLDDPGSVWMTTEDGRSAYIAPHQLLLSEEEALAFSEFDYQMQTLKNAGKPLTPKIMGRQSHLDASREADDATLIPVDRWFYINTPEWPKGEVAKWDTYDGLLVHRDPTPDDDRHSVMVSSEDGQRSDWCDWSDLRVTP